MCLCVSFPVCDANRTSGRYSVWLQRQRQTLELGVPWFYIRSGAVTETYFDQWIMTFYPNNLATHFCTEMWSCTWAPESSSQCNCQCFGTNDGKCSLWIIDYLSQSTGCSMFNPPFQTTLEKKTRLKHTSTHTRLSFDTESVRFLNATLFVVELNLGQRINEFLGPFTTAWLLKICHFYLTRVQINSYR